MTKLDAIEKAILQLSSGELARLRDWLDAFEGRLLDAMLERAAKSGGQGVREARGGGLADRKAGCARPP
jgi:hypothetical protein